MKAFLVPVGFLSATAFAATTPKAQVMTCEAHFEHAKTAFDEAEFLGCLAGIPKDRVAYVDVFATATPPGSSRFNREIAAARAQTLEEMLHPLLPDVTITAKGGGVNRVQGRTGRASFVLLPVPQKVETPKSATVALVSPAPVLLPPSIARALDSSPILFLQRMALRAGLDTFKTDRNPYVTTGGEWAWTPALGRGLRGEFGAAFGVASDDDVRNLYSLGAIMGATWSWKALSVGARATAGVLAHGGGQQVFDGGAEARVGVEWGSFSLFAGAGRSRNFKTRLGLDAGVRL